MGSGDFASRVPPPWRCDGSRRSEGEVGRGEGGGGGKLPPEGVWTDLVWTPPRSSVDAAIAYKWSLSLIISRRVKIYKNGK